MGHRGSAGIASGSRPDNLLLSSVKPSLRRAAKLFRPLQVDRGEAKPCRYNNTGRAGAGRRREPGPPRAQLPSPPTRCPQEETNKPIPTCFPSCQQPPRVEPNDLEILGPPPSPSPARFPPAALAARPYLMSAAVQGCLAECRTLPRRL